MGFLPSVMLQAPLPATTPILAVVQSVPMHLQVDDVSPATNTGGAALFKQVATVLSAVHVFMSPHLHSPVASSVLHVFPVWSVVPQVAEAPH